MLKIQYILFCLIGLFLGNNQALGFDCPQNKSESKDQVLSPEITAYNTFLQTKIQLEKILKDIPFEKIEESKEKEEKEEVKEFNFRLSFLYFFNQPHLLAASFDATSNLVFLRLILEANNRTLLAKHILYHRWKINCTPSMF